MADPDARSQDGSTSRTFTPNASPIVLLLAILSPGVQYALNFVERDSTELEAGAFEETPTVCVRIGPKSQVALENESRGLPQPGVRTPLQYLDLDSFRVGFLLARSGASLRLADTN
jgi:hypothetical protein